MRLSLLGVLVPVAFLALSGCKRDGASSAEAGAETGEESGGETGTETETGDGGSTGDGGCMAGTEDCQCTVLDSCYDGLECVDGLCVPEQCDPGEQGCPCGEADACDDGLMCAAGTCVPMGTCDYVNDFECDEPEGTGLCPEGTDVADCCPTPQDGNCEEMSMGGECPDGGADFYDCGYCPDPWQGDLYCDQPEGLDLCPADTDPLDCCGYKDGMCGEMSMGGECPDGSDNYDCGYCPDEWQGDGFCDEPQGEDLCPEGTDPLDC